jgi:hypothetical protein
MKLASYWLALPASFFVLVACGCSGKSKITGTVTLDGKPLPGAQVTFVPRDKKVTGGGGTQTGPDGKFELLPRPGSKEPLKPGRYVVLITQMVDKKGSVPSEEDYGTLSAAGELTNKLPDKYNNQEFPQFEVEIKPGDNELKPFDVNSK